MAKLLRKQIEWAYAQYLDGMTVQELAHILGVSDKTLYRKFDQDGKEKAFKWKKRITT